MVGTTMHGFFQLIYLKIASRVGSVASQRKELVNMFRETQLVILHCRQCHLHDHKEFDFQESLMPLEKIYVTLGAMITFR